MFYNAAGKKVYQAGADEESKCPECDVDLIARRGNIISWHWAHKANAENACGATETKWHLIWKSLYDDLPDWRIEYPITVGQKKFRIDAYNTRTKEIREFVHSLSGYYVAKHETLLTANYRTLWIWDGDAFVSKRAIVKRGDVSGVYWQDFLKPGPFVTFRQLGGYVHYQNFWWRHWKDNIWFTIESDATVFLNRRFSELIRKGVGHDQEGLLDKNEVNLSQESGRSGAEGVQ